MTKPADATAFHDALIRPAAVAVIGASDDPGKTAGRAQKYLKKHGYTGRIYPINPGRETVQGDKAWPSINALPEVPDHVYVCVGTGAVIGAVEACAAAGVPVVSILADGFSEAGPEGEARQQRLTEIARTSNTRILGPNSMGMVNCAEGIGLTVNAALDLDKLVPGRLMGISQSGSIVGTLISRGEARGIGFSSIVSVGNEADLTVGDIGLAAVADPGIDAFVLFMETIRKPEALAAFAAAARAADKPIIVYKLGRSEMARELAVSHTGALVGSDAACDAFYRAHGMVRVDQFETLIEAPPLLMAEKLSATETGGHEIRRDKPVAVITTTGGGGAMVVDRLGAHGIEVAGGSPALRAGLAEKGVKLGAGKLTDVTLAGAHYDAMLAVLDAFVSSGDFSVVISTVGSSAQFRPENAVQPIIDVDKTVTPMAAFMVPEANRALRSLGAAGIAGFRTAESCAEAVRALLERRPPAPPPVTPPVQLPTGLLPGAQDESQSLAIMASLGIAAVETVVARSSAPVPEGLAYPVAAKVLSADVPHKTEAGGVVLNIPGPEALADAMARIEGSVTAMHPEAEIDGISIQPMTTGLAEALIGFTRDAEVGPVVTLAVGGIMAEIHGDAAVRLAPIDRAGAQEMISEVKGLAPIRGYRGLPLGDLDALADAIVALSRLASTSGARVLEAEINPLIVRAEGEGVIAVDGLVVLGPDAI
jgi:acyl-CoA synthetase (NDP forming)